MLLHRYFGSHALESLRDTELKASRISEFNDPFEFAYRAVGDVTPEVALQQTLARVNSPGFYDAFLEHMPGLGTRENAERFVSGKIPEMAAALHANYPQLVENLKGQREAIADENVRLICFSLPEITAASQILQWAHYANKHQGIRIGFDLPLGLTIIGKLAQVEYRKERVPLDVTLEADSQPTQNALREAMEVKSVAWEYEQEYRLFLGLRQCSRRIINGKEEDFMKFDRAVVKSVDFGLRCPPAMIEAVLALLRAHYPAVIASQARHHPDDFALDYQVL